jgi:hypothetical protein
MQRAAGWSVCGALACLVVTLGAERSTAIAQGQVGCSRTVSPRGTVTEVCPGNQGTGNTAPPGNSGFGSNPPAVDRGAPPIRSRFGVPIPTCPPGKGYSIEHQACISAQQIGGTIPCSQDDQTFVGGRWVSNCR